MVLLFIEFGLFSALVSLQVDTNRQISNRFELMQGSLVSNLMAPLNISLYTVVYLSWGGSGILTWRTRSAPLFACVMSQICLTCRSSQRSATSGVTPKSIWTLSRPQRGCTGKNKNNWISPNLCSFVKKIVLAQPPDIFCLGDKKSFSALFPSNCRNPVPDPWAGSFLQQR